MQEKINKQKRQFLKGEGVRWKEEKFEVLEQTRYTTEWNYNALSKQTKQTDAKENTQYFHYDVACQLQATSIELKAKELQKVSKASGDSALAQMEAITSSASGLALSPFVHTIYDPRLGGEGLIEVSSENYEKIFKLVNKSGFKQTWSRKSKDYEPTELANFPSLSDEEINEIENYTIDVGPYTEETSTVSRNLTKAVAKLTPQRGVVFRGSYARKRAYGAAGSKGYKIYEGDVVTSDRFMSTSFSSITTDAFNLDPEIDVTESVFFLIESISGRNISQLSAESYQNEVLHLRGRNFIVNKIKKYKNSTTGVEMKYISLSEVEGPFLYQTDDHVMSLAKDIYTGITQLTKVPERLDKFPFVSARLNI